MAEYIDRTSVIEAFETPILILEEKNMDSVCQLYERYWNLFQQFMGIGNGLGRTDQLQDVCAGLVPFARSEVNTLSTRRFVLTVGQR